MPDANDEEITLGQKMMDNIFFLLALGLTFPAIFYFAWGMVEIFVFNTNQLSDYLSQSGQSLGGK